MKSKILNTFLAVLTFVSIGGVNFAHAQANDETDTAVIPFAFYADGQMMPAGKYTIGINVEQHSIQLTDYAQKKSIFVLGAPSGDGQYEWRLVFNKVGDKYSLEEMQSDVIDIGFRTRSHDKAVAQLSAPQQVEVALSRA